MNVARAVGKTFVFALAIVGLALFAFVARCSYVSTAYDREARDKTRAFCARFAPGASMDEARKAAEGLGDGDLRVIEADRVVVTFVTAPLHGHRCTVTGEGGKVLEAAYQLLD